MRRGNNSGKKFKRPKQKTLATTNPDAPRQPDTHRHEDRSECPVQVCQLLAKDSEWVDIVQPLLPGPEPSKSPSSSVGDEEAVLQLVECEDGPETAPLAIMFPGLLERDPKTFEGMLTKAMSTTEVTRNLVDLGAKANFQFVKKSERLIPRNKKWLDRVSEADTNTSQTSLDSNSISSANDADDENIDVEGKQKRKKKIRLSPENYASSSKQVECARSRTLSSDSSNSHNFTKVTVAALAIMDENQLSQRGASNKVPDEKKIKNNSK